MAPNDRPEKAYKNLEFLNSPAARHIRILCEYDEPRQRLHRHHVHDTIVFFGSARTMSSQDAAAHLAATQARIAQHGTPDPKLQRELQRAEVAARMSHYYDGARELARRLTTWSLERAGRKYTVCSGGGPGIMEAANRGASDVPGGTSVGLGISLPHEQGVNAYVTPELAFEFHYFFTRKYWFLYPCKGLVIFPGGFGTLDELFETLTLMQTKKVKKPMPVLMFGYRDYWSRVLNIEAMAEFGTVSQEDLALVHPTDDVDEAFAFLVNQLEINEQGAE
jgi:hypothetical protein